MLVKGRQSHVKDRIVFFSLLVGGAANVMMNAKPIHECDSTVECNVDYETERSCNECDASALSRSYFNDAARLDYSPKKGSLAEIHVSSTGHNDDQHLSNNALVKMTCAFSENQSTNENVAKHYFKVHSVEYMSLSYGHNEEHFGNDDQLLPTRFSRG